jgi:hypothetical protein
MFALLVVPAGSYPCMQVLPSSLDVHQGYRHQQRCSTSHLDSHAAAFFSCTCISLFVAAQHTL